MSFIKSIKNGIEFPLTVFSNLYEKLFYFPGDSSIYHEIKSENIEYSECFFTLKSNEKINTITLKTKNPKARVLHCHGSGFNITKHLTHVDWLSAHNIEVVMFDYPGYGKSDGIPTRRSTVDCVKELISYLANIDKLPLFIFGQSLGGNVASAAISDLPVDNFIRGAVLDSMYSSFRNLGKIKLERKLGKKFAFLTHVMSLFISDYQSPIRVAHKIKIPVLIFHSRLDSVVPLIQSFSFYQQLGSQDCEFISHGNSDHTDIFRYDIGGYRKSLVNWILSRV